MKRTRTRHLPRRARLAGSPEWCPGAGFHAHDNDRHLYRHRGLFQLLHRGSLSQRPDLYLLGPTQLRDRVLVEHQGRHVDSQPGNPEADPRGARSSRRSRPFPYPIIPQKASGRFTVTWADLTTASGIMSGHSISPKGMVLNGAVTASTNVFTPQDPVEGVVTVS